MVNAPVCQIQITALSLQPFSAQMPERVLEYHVKNKKK
jgi:hypothetical protein